MAKLTSDSVLLFAASFLAEIKFADILHKKKEKASRSK